MGLTIMSVPHQVDGGVLDGVDGLGDALQQPLVVGVDSAAVVEVGGLLVEEGADAVQCGGGLFRLWMPPRKSATAARGSSWPAARIVARAVKVPGRHWFAWAAVVMAVHSVSLNRGWVRWARCPGSRLRRRARTRNESLSGTPGPETPSASRAESPAPSGAGSGQGVLTPLLAPPFGAWLPSQ